MKKEEKTKKSTAAAGESPKRKAAKKPKIWLRIIVILLCLCIVVAAPFLLRLLKDEKEPEAQTVSYAFAADGREFYISLLTPTEKVLPDGYKKRGEADIKDAGKCPYFLNPDKPFGAYVLQIPVITPENGESYVFYVDTRLKDRELVSVDGKLYVSVESADYVSKTPDVDAKKRENAITRYGIYFEEEIPDGFERFGRAAFKGKDILPEGHLASNVSAAEVYKNDEEDVLLASATWNVAESGVGMVKRDGFKVYIPYEGQLLQDKK